MSLASGWIKVIFCHFKKENNDDIGQFTPVNYFKTG